MVLRALVMKLVAIGLSRFSAILFLFLYLFVSFPEFEPWLGSISAGELTGKLDKNHAEMDVWMWVGGGEVEIYSTNIGCLECRHASARPF